MTLPRITALLLLALTIHTAHPETVAVAHKEGTLHGYLALRSEDGKRLATGEIVQTIHGDHVSARLVYRFLDGSIDDERAVFTQHGTFRVLFDHHVQRGPAFPHPVDLTIDVPSRHITLRDRSGTTTKPFELPDDLANGEILTILKNLSTSAPHTKVSYLAAVPKPRLVHLDITPSQSDPIRIGSLHHKALCLLIHIELGGVAGVVAPLIGKQPGDIRVWVEQGTAPAFIRMEGAFYEGGPTWTAELTSPTFDR